MTHGRCTSGRSIPEISYYGGKECGETLVILRGALVCPRCDALPGKAGGKEGKLAQQG